MALKLSALWEKHPSRQTLSLGGLSGAALAYALFQAFSRLNKPIYVFVPDPKGASQLAEDLSFYLGSREKIHLFPATGVLPYYGLSPNPDSLAGRIHFLYSLLKRREASIAILSLSAIARRLPPPKIFDECSDYLVSGEEIDREALVK